MRKTLLGILGITLACGMNMVSGEQPDPRMEQDFLRLRVGPDGQLIAATTSGVYLSLDDGGRWDRVLNVYQPKLISTRRLLFVVDGSGNRFRSNDFGKTWGDDGKLDPESMKLINLAGESLDGHIYYCKAQKVRVSGDAGKNWRELSTPDGCDRVIANEKMMYVEGNRSVYSSEDHGEHWSKVEQSTPYSWPELVNLTIDNNGILYAETVAGGAGIFESRDQGKTWRKETFGLSDDARPTVYRVRPDAVYLFMAGRDRGIRDRFYRSVDGKSATRMALEFPWYWDIQPSKNGAIYVVTWEFIYKSVDSGNSWEALGKKGLIWPPLSRP
jgi:hypothetical protein